MAGDDVDARTRAAEDDPRCLGGRYELGGLLGRGGMGEVRAGTDRRLDRPVAVKLLREDYAADPESRARFESEARAAARLAHPHAVAVFDSGEDGGVPYLVMERLPGTTLADRIADGPLPADEVRRLGAHVLAALEAAHAAGIVHRDVKPGNVLLAADGTWKVADFGIAKSVEATTDLTLTGGLVGTPAYVAPERLEGGRALPSSDLYSLGVVLYEAVSGRKPFAADTPLALAHMIRGKQAPPLRSLAPGVDRVVLATVERAMDRDPARRFADAAEMARTLAGAGDAPTVAVAPEPTTRRMPVTPAASVRGRGRRLRGRAPLWAALGAAAVVLSVVVVVALGRLIGSDGNGASGEPPAMEAPAGTAGDVSVTGERLPGELREALERLEQAVER